MVLPYFNGSRLADTSISSVLEQTFPDYELIIVDDGSEPSEAAFLDRYCDSRIVRLRQENRGVSSARNNGIEKATGDWVAFIDQDDYWQPNKLERQINYLSANPDCQALHTAVRRRKADGVEVEYRKKRLGLEDFLGPSPNPAYLSSTLIKRESIISAGLFSPQFRYSQDRECFLRCAMQFDFHYLDELLVVRHEHDNNLSANKPGVWHEAVQITRLYQDQYQSVQSFRSCLYAVHLNHGLRAMSGRDWRWVLGILAELDKDQFSRVLFLMTLVFGGLFGSGTGRYQ